jgi:hypothetical protein
MTTILESIATATGQKPPLTAKDIPGFIRKAHQSTTIDSYKNLPELAKAYLAAATKALKTPDGSTPVPEDFVESEPDSSNGEIECL